MQSRFRAALLCCALLLPALAARGVELGQPLAAALEELRAAGLGLVFSSALVPAELRVTVEPDGGTPEEIARRILAPHALALDTIRPGLFAVVRRPSAPLRSASTRPSSGEPEPLDVVEIYASRYLIEQQSSAAALAEIGREELDTLPGLGQDALRVTRFLPGTASSAFSARAHVRGGREDELGIFFDGVPLYDPFHFKDLHGLFGILDPGAISSIDFFSGVFPARFGGRLSGVLDIQPRRREDRNTHALGASVLYTNALSQGRMRHRPVEWLAAVRRSNVELFADLAEWEDAEPDFFDALARVEIEMGARSRLALGWLRLDDSLEATFDDDASRARISHRDATVWLGWHFAPDELTELQATLSQSERHGDRQGRLEHAGAASGTLVDRRQLEAATIHLEGSRRFSPRVQIAAGLEANDYRADYDFESSARFEPALAAVLGHPDAIAYDFERQAGGQAYAAFASALVSPWPSIDVDAGFRWDAQRFRAEFRGDQLSPRLALQWHPRAATTVRASWGHLSQAQRPDELHVADGDPRYHVVQRARQSVLSIERRLSHGSILRAEAFEKRVRSPRPAWENLLDPLALLPELEVDRVRLQAQSSRTYGAELSLRWQAGEHWSGWSAYSWSEAVDEFAALSAPRSWDQRNSLAASVAWSRTPWQLAASLTWHSGWPRTDLVVDESGVLRLAPRNAESWPDHFSLDLRASWTRALPRGALRLSAEIGNVTGHENLCCASYALSDSSAALERDTSTWLPRYALFGVTWELP